MTINTLGILVLAAGLACACTATDRKLADNNSKVEPEVTACEDPRPQICTMEYRPVCAMLDSAELKTYSSGCSACSDAAVQQYRPGACEE